MHEVSWILPSIPHFTERAGPFREFLKAEYEKSSGIRKKNSIAKIPLSDIEWNERQVEAFNVLKEQIIEAAQLYNRGPEQTFCVHTNASEKHWKICALNATHQFCIFHQWIKCMSHSRS